MNMLKDIMKRLRSLAALLLALWLAGCNGAVPVARRPVGQGPTLNPLINFGQLARLTVSVTVSKASGKQRTQALPQTFDHAVALLAGPLLANSPRDLPLQPADFSGSSVLTVSGAYTNLRPGDG